MKGGYSIIQQHDLNRPLHSGAAENWVGIVFYRVTLLGIWLVSLLMKIAQNANVLASDLGLKSSIFGIIDPVLQDGLKTTHSVRFMFGQICSYKPLNR